MNGAVYDERPIVTLSGDCLVATIPLPVPSPDEKMGGRLLNKKTFSLKKLFLCLHFQFKVFQKGINRIRFKSILNHFN